MTSGACLVGPSTTAQVNRFLNEYPPSANQHTETGWIWCQLSRCAEGSGKPAENQDHASFEEEGAALVQDLVEECRKIKETAPVRANKKKGLKSQKELREAKHAEFNESVKELAHKHGVLSGKWLFFCGHDTVDSVWGRIVNELAAVDGALAQTGAVHCAKVSSVAEEGGNYVICVYCDDSWDKDGVATAFKALVQKLRLVSAAYKCDANTILGIDSKHESGIRSSMYGKNDFMTAAEINEAFKETTKAKEVKRKTLEEEQAGGDGFDTTSESEDDESVKKKAKRAKT
ncbi:hypothetical protein JCM5296_001370 [Sporobolomyces johnsonii]